MAGKACHVVAFAARIGLIPVLGAMSRMIAAVTLIISLTVPIQAIACRLGRIGEAHDPADVKAFEYMLQSSAIVVLARPIEIKRVPISVKGPYLSLADPYQQVVQWAVLYSWKGSQPDDKFWTSMRIESGLDSCAARNLVSDYSAKFFYASGKSPFTNYHIVEVDGAARDLMYLQEIFNPVAANPVTAP